MKALLFILMWVPVLVKAQDHTKQYVTSKGDTVRPGSRLQLGPAGNFRYIYLHPDGALDKMRIEAARRYLGTNMPGQAYQVTRLTRIPSGKKKYKPIAVIKVQDPQIHRMMAVEYFIDIENALKSGEINLR